MCQLHTPAPRSGNRDAKAVSLHHLGRLPDSNDLFPLHTEMFQDEDREGFNMQQNLLPSVHINYF